MQDSAFYLHERGCEELFVDQVEEREAVGHPSDAEKDALGELLEKGDDVVLFQQIPFQKLIGPLAEEIRVIDHEKPDQAISVLGRVQVGENRLIEVHHEVVDALCHLKIRENNPIHRNNHVNAPIHRKFFQIVVDDIQPAHIFGRVLLAAVAIRAFCDPSCGRHGGRSDQAERSEAQCGFDSGSRGH